jgi:hypothetical protein
MCSPAELEKLLKDDILFKQYIILQIDKISENTEKTDVCDSRIDELSNTLIILSEKIDKIEKDVIFFKRLIITLISTIVALLGYNIGII